ncbi:MAG: hypothetical protein NC337_14475 [Roseburia sp.]|nr:hypothetical protein [Roseburia sp.]
MCDKKYFDDDCIPVWERLYLSFSKSPLIKNEVFCEEDRTAIFRAIFMVKDKILLQDKSRETVIRIGSLQYDVCYYQAEAMTAAMLNWCAEAFHFELPDIRVDFDTVNNRYVFDFK